MTETVTDTSHPVLLYDGLCGFCSKGVQRILRYDKRKTMLFAALQGDYGKSILLSSNSTGTLIMAAGVP